MARRPEQFKSAGPQDIHRVLPSYLNRDARPTLQRLTDALANPETVAGGIAFMGVTVLLFPEFLNAAIVVVAALYFWYHTHPESLDIRIPLGGGKIDPNDPKPGRKSYRKPRGIFPLGNNTQTRKQVWLAREDLLTHILIFGTTGSGKSYLLTGLSGNYAAMGGGLIYVDAKAASSLTRDIHAISCALGRDDHFLVMNLITGNRTINARAREKFSNTFNFMVFGSAASIADTMISLLGSGGDDANSVFKDNAISLMTATLMVLVDLRDAKLLTLGPNKLREWMTLEQLMSVSDFCRKGYNNGNPAQTNARFVRALRPETMETLNAYLKGLPAFDPTKTALEQGETTNDQFGYARMYWNRALNMLSDTYRHIFWTDVADVDMRDVIMHRRILVVLLPALEKAPADLLALGKIILSALKSAVSTNLPARIIGPREEIDRPAPACPGGIILDEYAYINTPGFAVMPAQARGLGIGLVFAGQDFAGFKRADENEAKQIISNTTIKIAMRMEDAEDTFNLFKTAAGDAKVSQVAGFSTEGATLANYVSTGSISLESVPRLDFNDFKRAIEGDAFIFYRDKIITASMLSHEMPKDMKSTFIPATTLPVPFFPAQPYSETRKSAMEALIFLSKACRQEAMSDPDDEKLAARSYGMSYDLRHAGAALEAIRLLPEWQDKSADPSDFINGTLAGCVEPLDEGDTDAVMRLATSLRRAQGLPDEAGPGARPVILPTEEEEAAFAQPQPAEKPAIANTPADPGMFPDVMTARTGFAAEPATARTQPAMPTPSVTRPSDTKAEPPPPPPEVVDEEDLAAEGEDLDDAEAVEADTGSQTDFAAQEAEARARERAAAEAEPEEPEDPLAPTEPAPADVSGGGESDSTDTLGDGREEDGTPEAVDVETAGSADDGPATDSGEEPEQQNAAEEIEPEEPAPEEDATETTDGEPDEQPEQQGEPDEGGRDGADDGGQDTDGDEDGRETGDEDGSKDGEDGESGTGDGGGALRLDAEEQDRLRGIEPGMAPEARPGPLEEAETPAEEPDAEAAERRHAFRDVSDAIGVPRTAGDHLEDAVQQPIYPETPVEPKERTADHRRELAEQEAIIRRTMQRIRRRN